MIELTAVMLNQFMPAIGALFFAYWLKRKFEHQQERHARELLAMQAAIDKLEGRQQSEPPPSEPEPVPEPVIEEPAPLPVARALKM